MAMLEDGEMLTAKGVVDAFLRKSTDPAMTPNQRDAAYLLLNRLEDACVLIKHDVVDEQVLKHSIYAWVCQYWPALRAHKSLETTGPAEYECLSEIHTRWEKDPPKLKA